MMNDDDDDEDGDGVHGAGPGGRTEGDFRSFFFWKIILSYLSAYA